MQFSLYSTLADHPSTECYFRMETESLVLYSPFYPDQRTAVEAMERLVRRLRRDSAKQYISATKDQQLALKLFGKSQPAVGSEPVFEERPRAMRLLKDWQRSARASTFKITFWELAEENGQVEDLSDLELAVTDRNYFWQQAGSSVLHVDKSGKMGFKPSIGVHIDMARDPCEPLFNALKPFVSADFPLFKGRKREVEEVHTLLRRRPLLLVYGEPRVGKSSLLQCGLANRVKKDEEPLIVVRREKDDIITTLTAKLKEELAKYPDVEAVASDDPLALAHQLGELTEKRQFIVFDQLEELFSATIFDDEREALFEFINELVSVSNPNFRVILVLQENYLAPLADHEDHLPSLLENRFRLLPISESSMVDATVNFLDVLALQNKIKVDDSQAVAEKICSELADEDGNVPAHCLQIYLHQLHQASCQETEEGPIPLDTDVVERFGPARRLIDDFYEKRLDRLSEKRVTEDGTPNPIVEQRIEKMEEGREDCGCEKKKSRAVAAAAVAPVPTPSNWWLLAALPLFPLGMFLAWWLLPTGGEALTPCQILEQQEGSCEAYINYLCQTDDDGTCAPAWLATMDLEDCEVWRDYQNLRNRSSCTDYQAFFFKYRDRGICTDYVSARLLDWKCPIVRDTLRDTIIQRLPAEYQNVPRIPPATITSTNDATPPCQQIGTTTFKSVGPLFIMTDALPGGPYRWEDALDACSERGWRLPCIGEIDFLIEKIYRDDPARAYGMLTGSGECYLVNPAESPSTARIEFWTATEANDATAWSYYFDTVSKTIGRQSATPKSARMPCLCVKTDPEKRGSSLPPCYQKSVDRRAPQ